MDLSRCKPQGECQPFFAAQRLGNVLHSTKALVLKKRETPVSHADMSTFAVLNRHGKRNR